MLFFCCCCRKAVGFHRKTLSPNPYTYKDLPSRRNRPQPSPKPVSTKTVPQKKSSSSTQEDVSPPPRSSASSSVAFVPVVVGCAVFLLLLATAVFCFTRKAGKSVNPWRTGLSGQLQKVFVTGNFFALLQCLFGNYTYLDYNCRMFFQLIVSYIYTMCDFILRYSRSQKVRD